MRLHSILKHALVASVAIFSLQSCDNDDNDYDYSLLFPNAFVTVKTDANDTFFLQLDDKTTLLPVNVTKSPFGEKEVRALVNYDETTDPAEGFSKSVHINWIDSILTKPIAQRFEDEEENDNVYGTDPVEILNSWMTVSEDGYLTLRFSTTWGNTGTKHFVNLVPTNNPENKYELEFRHNAYGDVNGHLADGLVAFKLDQLPDTNGETVKLKLIWKSFSGEKSYEFDYCTRQSTPANPDMTSVRAKNLIN